MPIAVSQSDCAKADLPLPPSSRSSNARWRTPAAAPYGANVVLDCHIGAVETGGGHRSRLLVEREVADLRDVDFIDTARAEYGPDQRRALCNSTSP